MASEKIPEITVYFLQASRCIRTVWLLEELGLPYNLEFSDRENMVAPKPFKEMSGNPLGKFPVLKHGDIVIHESGAITEFLCEKYDHANRLIPKDDYARARTLTFIHAAEGTLFLHGGSILYFRWRTPQTLKDNNAKELEETEEKMAANVINDFNWLETELGRSTGSFLVGNNITAADIMMLFSVQFIQARDLGVKGHQWPRVAEWAKKCEATETYKRAVEKSGHTLYPEQT